MHRSTYANYLPIITIIIYVINKLTVELRLTQTHIYIYIYLSIAFITEKGELV